MTSLYGITEYFDWEDLERILYPNHPPTNPDDCSGTTRRLSATQTQTNNILPPYPKGIAGWLKLNRPMWYHLYQKAHLEYVLNNNLQTRTLFLPPESSIQEANLEKWSLGHLRRLLSMLIFERPMPPAYLRRSQAYKLYTFEQYVPVYIRSWDNQRFFFQDAEILDGFAIRPDEPIRIGSVPYAQQNTYHYIHNLASIPTLDCFLGVYAD